MGQVGHCSLVVSPERMSALQFRAPRLKETHFFR